MSFLTHYRRLYYVYYSTLGYPAIQGLLKIIKRIIRQNSFVFTFQVNWLCQLNSCWDKQLLLQDIHGPQESIYSTGNYMMIFQSPTTFDIFDPLICFVSIAEEMPNYWKHEILGTSVESDCVHLSYIKYIFLGSTWHLNMKNGHLCILSSLWTQL